MSRNLSASASNELDSIKGQLMSKIVALINSSGRFLMSGVLSGVRVEVKDDVEAQRLTEEIRGLIEMGADVNLKVANSFTVAHLAAVNNDSEFLKFLLERPEINLDALDKRGNNVLHVAVEHGDCFSVFVALQALTKDAAKSLERINLLNAAKESPLQKIAQNFSPEVAIMLMEEGATPLDYSKEPEGTLKNIMMAVAHKASYPRHCMNNRMRGFSILYEKGCEENLKKSKEDFGSELISLELINYVQKSFRKIIEEPSEEGVIQIIMSNLLTLAGNITQYSGELLPEGRDKNGTEFLNARLGPWYELLRILQTGILAHKNCVNVKGEGGLTALHLAAITKTQFFWNFLLQNGAQVLPNDEGDDPLKLLQQKTVWGEGLLLATRPARPAPLPPAPAPVFKRDLEPQIAPKSLPERWQNSLNHLYQSKETHPSIYEITSLLEDGVDVNTKITNDYTALHIAAKIGSKELLEALSAKQANINAKAIGDLSVLRCAINTAQSASMRDVITSVLSREDLDLEIIVSELKTELAAAKKTNPWPAEIILTNETLLKRVSALGGEERRKLIEELRSAYQDKSPKVKEVFKKVVTDFEKKLQEKATQAEVAPNTERLSKTQLKKNRDAAKKAQKEQEESEAQIKKFLFEVRGESQRIAKESIDLASSKISTIQYSSEAQMNRFLRGERQINSLQDLPEFLQPTLHKLLENGCRVTLKGSAVYLKPNQRRTPTDLDIEVRVEGINGWQDDKIAQFAKTELGLEILPENIYRQQAIGTRPAVFTVNAKDSQLKLDWSIYDPALEPPHHLSWTTNRETKIDFTKNGQVFKPKSAAELQINPRAYGLILRLCFLEAIGHLSEEEIESSLVQTLQEKPANLLVRELKILNGGAAKPPKEIILNYLESHSLDENEKKRFVANLSKMLEMTVNADRKAGSPHLALSQVVGELVQLFDPPQQKISASAVLKFVPEKNQLTQRG